MLDPKRLQEEEANLHVSLRPDESRVGTLKRLFDDDVQLYHSTKPSGWMKTGSLNGQPRLKTGARACPLS